MKILGVRFLNLNSLKGLHEIRFDQSPLAESGLFAITGPTGAGKTTLLDAITVGLFGRVHRHDRDAYEIMTRHTGESFSEVDFEVKGQHYRSKWAIYRSRNKADGKLQPTRMELFSFREQKLLDLKPSEVPGKVAEISGLDYSQFLRSVILSQGDFTRFLKASESERSDLLEKITDTGIYTQISVAAYRQADKEKKTLEHLRARLNNSILLTEEQVTSFREKVATFQLQIQEQTKHKQIREQQLNWLARLEQLQQKKTGLAAHLQVLEADFEAQQSEFTKLQQHQQALPFKPALIQIKTSQHQAERLGQDLVDVSTRLPDFNKQTEEAAIKLRLAQQQLQQVQQELDQAEPIFHEVTRQDSLISSQEDFYRKSYEHVTVAEAELHKTKQLLEEKQTALRLLQADITQVRNWLQQNQSARFLDREIITYQQDVKDLHDISRKLQEINREQTQQNTAQITSSHFIQEQTLQLEQDHTIQAATEKQMILLQQTSQHLLNGQALDVLVNSCQALPVQINLLEQQFLRAGQYQQIRRKTEALQTSLHQNERELTVANQQATDLTTTRKLATEKLQHLQQIVYLQRQIQKYEADRQLLQEQQPCPLCGSEHHPFVVHAYQPELTESEEIKQVQEQLVAQLITQQTSLAGRLSSLQALVINEKNQIGQLQSEESNLENQFAIIQEKLTKKCSIDNPDAIQRIIIAYQNHYRQQQQLLTNVRRHTEESRRLEKKLQEQKESSLRREYEIKRAQQRVEQAHQNLERLQTNLLDLQEQQKAVSGQVQSFLLRFEISFELQKSAQIEADLQNRAKAFTTQTEQLQTLGLTLKQTETELKNLSEQSTQKEQVLQQLQMQLRQEQARLKQLKNTRHELFGAKNPQVERDHLRQALNQHHKLLENLRAIFQEKQEQMRLAQSRQQQWQTELSRVQAQVSTLQEQLHHSVRAKNIDSIETLVKLFLHEDEAHRIELLQKQADRALTESRKLHADTEQELAQEQSRQLTTSPQVILQTEVDDLNSQIAHLHQQIGSLDLQLRQDAELKIKHRETAEQVELQQKEFLRWDKLAALIGSADGKKFSKFAQGLTLARLTELANRHLLRLNPRYQILKNPTQDLELQIIDTYQADAIRSMNTLSGGESFLVSLALALGLSDLAGRKAQINSLFIDEGFGTLDTDTLDIAISALENLQASGKLIGVISHVEALKERMSTQIQVSKQVGGQSTIKIVVHASEAYL